jgi:lipopolysaccharide export system protein LptA
MKKMNKSTIIFLQEPKNTYQKPLRCLINDVVSFVKNLIAIQCSIILLLLPLFAIAQDDKTKKGIGTTPEEKPTPVELMQAGRLQGDRVNGEDIRIVVKDSSIANVIFRQNGAYLYCDSALQFLAQNKLNAYYHIRIIDTDGTNIIADSLLYDGNTRIARLRGNVVLQDEEQTVYSCCMDYNLSTKVGSYFNGGRVISKQNTVESEKGYYYTSTKMVYFRDKVTYTSPETTLNSDTLTYNIRAKQVVFNAKTKIKTKEGLVITDRGKYFTESGKTEFTGRSKIDTEDYTISGDVLDYSKKTGKGVAKGNVEFFGKKDNIIILGDLGKHDGSKKRSEIYGNAVMIKPIEEKGVKLRNQDTLFLSADTLISINDTTTKNRRLLAYNHVKMYRNVFQAKCDSLVYNLVDSIIYFHYNPILWAKNSQMTADSINITLRNNQIDKMNLNVKAFIVSQDTIKNFNQVKGRKIIANFKQNNLHKIDVNGNAESIFHVLESDTLLMGLNFIKSSEMFLFFNDSSKLNEILFLKEPEGKFVPPHEINAASSQLKDFAWRTAEKPEKGEVLGIHNKNRFRSGELAKALMVVDDNYKVFLKDNKLFFYKGDAEKRDIMPKIYIQAYAVDKNDLPIEKRKEGYEELSFEIPDENLAGSVAKYDIELPTFKLKKLVIYQKSTTRGLLWQKNYDYPIKREFKKPKKG